MKISRRQALAGIAGAALAGPALGQSLDSLPNLADLYATPEATAVYRYLWNIFGKKTLTGQQESIWQEGGPRHELNYIQQVTGKEPAVLGLDYIDPKDRQGVNDRATAWYGRGGIPTICWHWGNPLVGPGYEQSKIFFDAKKAFADTASAEHAAMWRDLKEIGDHLEQLRDRKVPVLWRPFHEFTGDWFWWGKQGPEVFKSLWLVMYDYFSNDRKLDNLIWVLGYSRKVDPAYHPGEGSYDILSADNYIDGHDPQKGMWDDLKALGGGRPIAMQENGPIPDPELMRAQRTPWLYFLTWHSEFIMDGKANAPEFLKRVYNDDSFVTLDEMPRWS